jgi:hypothetical protein
MFPLRRIAPTLPVPLAAGLVVVVVALVAAAAYWLRDGMSPSNHQAATAAAPVVILVSGDTAGWIVPCGCMSNQSGGLLRRGAFVRQWRKTHYVVLLDAGGAPAGSSSYDRAKFEAILDGERLSGLNAHNLGGPELALGAEYLRDVGASKKAPFISANASDAAGRPLAEPYRVVEAGGRRIAVVGVVGERFATTDCRVAEPRAAVLAAHAALRGQVDWLIVLAYLPEEELRALASALPEADAIVGGPTGQSIAPERRGPTLLASATNKGKFLVSLVPPAADVHAPWSASVVEMSAELPDDPDQKQNLAHFRAALEARDFTAADSGLASSDVFPTVLRVAGSAACKECHESAHHAWETSAHAHAWRTLIEQQAHVDSYCQQCHTTGFGWPGGFVSARQSVQLTSVGCESCHGPAQAHALRPAERTPLAAHQACTRCHDRENSPAFEYETYWKRIAHGAEPPD